MFIFLEPASRAVSHANVDQTLARKLRNLISESTSVEVFTTEELNAGSNWQTRMRRELESADVVLALLTPKSVDSSWVLHELGAAWALRKPIIPVITRRDVLTRMPIPLEVSSAIELPDIDNAADAERFTTAFEDSIATTRTA